MLEMYQEGFFRHEEDENVEEWREAVEWTLEQIMLEFTDKDK